MKTLSYIVKKFLKLSVVKKNFSELSTTPISCTKYDLYTNF